MKEEILTLKEALAKAVDKLQQMEVPDADIDAWYLLSYVTGLDRSRDRIPNVLWNGFCHM